MPASAATPPAIFVQPRPREIFCSSALPRVEVSPSVLEALFHLRQEDAATALVSPGIGLGHRALTCSSCEQGISLTSFKSACRRIGLSRWPYNRWEPDSEDESARNKRRRKRRSTRKAQMQLKAIPSMAQPPEGSDAAQSESLTPKTEYNAAEDGHLQSKAACWTEEGEAPSSIDSLFCQSDILFPAICQDELDQQWLFLQC
eukprot:305574-Hanusia_phi.AAC.1